MHGPDGTNCPNENVFALQTQFNRNSASRYLQRRNTGYSLEIFPATITAGSRLVNLAVPCASAPLQEDPLLPVKLRNLRHHRVRR